MKKQKKTQSEIVISGGIKQVKKLRNTIAALPLKRNALLNETKKKLKVVLALAEKKAPKQIARIKSMKDFTVPHLESLKNQYEKFNKLKQDLKSR